MNAVKNLTDLAQEKSPQTRILEPHCYHRSTPHDLWSPLTHQRTENQFPRTSDVMHSYHCRTSVASGLIYGVE
jgi:hypothetical protein